MLSQGIGQDVTMIDTKGWTELLAIERVREGEREVGQCTRPH